MLTVRLVSIQFVSLEKKLFHSFVGVAMTPILFSFSLLSSGQFHLFGAGIQIYNQRIIGLITIYLDSPLDYGVTSNPLFAAQ